MRILFVVPHQHVRYKPSIDLPLGVMSIASYLRTTNFDGTFEIYDASLSGQQWADNDGIKFLGDRPEEIEKRIRSYQPNIVSISNM